VAIQQKSTSELVLWIESPSASRYRPHHLTFNAACFTTNGIGCLQASISETVADIQKDLRLVYHQNFFQEKLHTAKQDATVLGLLLMFAVVRLEERNARNAKQQW
jgi:hypothetical protein